MEEASIPTAEELQELLRNIAETFMPFGMYGPKNFPPRGCPISDLPNGGFRHYPRKK